MILLFSYLFDYIKFEHTHIYYILYLIKASITSNITESDMEMSAQVVNFFRKNPKFCVIMYRDLNEKVKHFIFIFKFSLFIYSFI